MASSMLSPVTSVTRASVAQASMVAPFTGLKFTVFFPVTRRLDADITSVASNGGRVQCMEFNFVGRLLGPRGNPLKRVEASTGCRVYIRGKGSIKDPDKEEMLRGRPGYEHLNEPLHILIEADLPANIVDVRLGQAHVIIEELLKPVDESQDYIKREQLRELALLNSNFRENSPGPSGSVSPFNTSGMKQEGPGPSGSVSPFNTIGMKRAKTGR